MNFLSLWSRGELLALGALIVGSIGALAAVMVVPELRRFLRLDNPRSGHDRRRRRSLFFAYIAVCLFVSLIVSLVAWRVWVEPKLVKWEVIESMQQEEVKAETQPYEAETQPPRQIEPREPSERPTTELPTSAIEVLEGSRADDNIGGGTVVVDIWQAAKVEEVSVSKITALFEPVVDPQALVNLALQGTVLIHEVRLSTVKRQFEVSLKVENVTDSQIVAEVPKGQVFENKKPKERRQNLASRQLASVDLPPHQVIEVKVDALCINQNWMPPKGGEGNITVFRIKEDFSGQHDLWARIQATVRGEAGR